MPLGIRSPGPAYQIKSKKYFCRASHRMLRNNFGIDWYYYFALLTIRVGAGISKLVWQKGGNFFRPNFYCIFGGIENMVLKHNPKYWCSICYTCYTASDPPVDQKMQQQQLPLFCPKRPFQISLYQTKSFYSYAECAQNDQKLWSI